MKNLIRNKTIKRFYALLRIVFIACLILSINNVKAQSPIITFYTPTNSCIDKATTIQIVGKNFTGTTAVMFGNKLAPYFRVNSDTSITAITPKGVQNGVITIFTVNGTGSSSKNFGIVNEKIENKDTVIQQGDSTTLFIGYDNYNKYDIIDFSPQFNFNNKKNFIEYANIPTGSQVLGNVPFYIYPWTDNFNGWNASFVKHKNPILLSLNTFGKFITAIDLLANTYYGVMGKSLNTVQFWSSGKLIYEKKLYGGVDTRDYNGNPKFLTSINNTTTINVWSDTLMNKPVILRLDKIRIQLPKASNIDKVLVVDNGNKSSRIFVLAATLENANPAELSILWSTGSTENSIVVAPNKTTTYYAKIGNETNSCLDSVRITVNKPFVFTDTANIVLTATAIEGKRVAINWSVSSANYVTNYTVQHSIDGINFSDLMSVSPATSSNYSYVDTKAIKGLNYYRIKAAYNLVFYNYSNKILMIQ